jgi:hypothetical protein
MAVVKGWQVDEWYIYAFIGISGANDVGGRSALAALPTATVAHILGQRGWTLHTAAPRAAADRARSRTGTSPRPFCLAQTGANTHVLEGRPAIPHICPVPNIPLYLLQHVCQRAGAHAVTPRTRALAVRTASRFAQWVRRACGKAEP